MHNKISEPCGLCITWLTTFMMDLSQAMDFWSCCRHMASWEELRTSLSAFRHSFIPGAISSSPLRHTKTQRTDQRGGLFQTCNLSLMSISNWLAETLSFQQHTHKHTHTDYIVWYNSVAWLHSHTWRRRAVCTMHLEVLENKSSWDVFELRLCTAD